MFTVSFDGIFAVDDGAKSWSVSQDRRIITNNTTGRTVKADGALGQRILAAVHAYCIMPLRQEGRVPVATQPSVNAPNFRNLVAEAERVGDPFVDSVTPDGHFGVIVKSIGGVQTYWLRGNLTDPETAVVVGRTGDGGHFIGGGVLGGRCLRDL